MRCFGDVLQHTKKHEPPLCGCSSMARFFFIRILYAHITGATVWDILRLGRCMATYTAYRCGGV